jgi:hypothetical protein
VLPVVMDRHTPFAIVILHHQHIVVAGSRTSIDPACRHDCSKLDMHRAAFKPGSVFRQQGLPTIKPDDDVKRRARGTR